MSHDTYRERAGMSARSDYDDKYYWMPGGYSASDVYEYADEKGATVFGVSRAADLDDQGRKVFSQWRPDEGSATGRRWSLKDDSGKRVRTVPFQLPRVLAAVAAGEVVYVAEGEKDVLSLERAGATATCNSGGAGKWAKAHAKFLQDASVVIVADKDAPGYSHARTVLTTLEGVAASVRVVCAAEGKDATDHLDAGHGLNDFVPLDMSAPQPDWSRGPAGSASTPPDAPAHLHTPPALAADLDILRRAVVQLRVCRGLVGEVRTVKLLYLAFTSRLLDDPVNVAVKGLSSSGKSYTVECVADLMPPEALFVMTAMSERALIYLKEPLKHRTLVLFEAVALQENREKSEGNMAAYIVRSLLSEGQIKYPVVVKDESGQFATTVVTVEGPTNLITSTTSVSLHGENETRMLSLPSDDSAAQTRAILVGAAGERKRAESDLTEWHNLQRWIAQQDTRVTIPFAACVAAQIEPVAVRLRRDWNAIRSLIRAHALLHQQNRERDASGAVVATTDDYAAVRSLAGDLISEAIGAGVPATIRATVGAVAMVTGELGHAHATVRDVARGLDIERSSAQRRLATAMQYGYLRNTQDRRGQPGQYVTGDPLPGSDAVLPAVAQLCTPPCAHLAADVSADQPCLCTGVCRCARASGGVKPAEVVAPTVAGTGSDENPPAVATESNESDAAKRMRIPHHEQCQGGMFCPLGAYGEVPVHSSVRDHPPKA